MRAQRRWNRLCGPGAGGFGKFKSARMMTTGQRTVAVTANTRWIASATQTCAGGVAAELARGPLFPAVEPDVDLEHDHGRQEHDAQTDLHPLVKLVSPTILDLIDAPREDDDHDGHGDHQHVEHEGGPRAEKAVETGIVDRVHGSDNSRNRTRGIGLDGRLRKGPSGGIGRRYGLKIRWGANPDLLSSRKTTTTGRLTRIDGGGVQAPLRSTCWPESS